MKLLTKLGVVVAAITAGAVMAPGTALAASWVPISGTVYSNGNWYTSTNVRTKSGTTAVKVQFNNLPGGGLKFYIKNYNTGVRLGIIGYFPPTGPTTLASSVSGGTKFVTVFAQQTKKSPYNFDGSLYY